MSQPVVPPEIPVIAENLLIKSGWGPIDSIVPLAGGRNNRVYRVVSDSGSAILKQYHRVEGAGRDRFASELAWYRYCQSLKVEQVPQLWAADEKNRCALFSEVPGRKLIAREVAAGHVSQAAEFFIKVNLDRSSALAANLPVAADACFCIDDFLTQVDIRLQRLRNLPITDSVTAELQSWLTESLFPQWQMVSTVVEQLFDREKRLAVLTEKERCVSPSDFGFHNAILTPNDRLVFLDFEYAGWDDPAKMICDFFWQVDVPAPRETLPIMLNAASSFGDSLRERVRHLFPVMGIKWCTIVLNEFLNDGKARREFSAAVSLHDSIRNQQLQIARRILDDVKELENHELF